MPGRSRRRRGTEPSPPTRPPAGLVEEISGPPPETEPVAAVVEPPPVLTVAGEFRTASAALVFAGGFADVETAEYGHCTPLGTWWVAGPSTLSAARELIAAAGGRMHVEVDGRLVPDRGWGDGAPTGAPADRPEVVAVKLLDLVRTAGLHPHVLPIGEQVTVIAPARRVSGIAQRALDLELTIAARLLRLDPLFTDGGAAAEPPRMFELRLASPAGPLPIALLTALDRDVSVLVCRRVSDRLLVQLDMASPLSDGQLAALAERDTATGGWLLADTGFGSARLTPLTDLRDGAAFVRLSDRHRLDELDEGWAAVSRACDEPELNMLRLVRARTPDAVVDAVLLDDDDLACLPALLAGRPLADLAVLATGRDKHLMLAPGGVLERLPVGEPLYRLGPGPLFLPLGTRTQPLLPPTARRALFPSTADTALVLQPESIVAFPLANREPVWALWAGPLPPIDLQLPRAARRVLAEVDAQTTPALPQPRSAVGRLGQRLAEQIRGPAAERPVTWQDEALAAELADDLVRAAELCERNGEPRRAAYLYERAARRSAHRPAGR